MRRAHSCIMTCVLLAFHVKKLDIYAYEKYANFDVLASACIIACTIPTCPFENAGLSFVLRK